MRRDFTYIDDIVAGIMAVTDTVPQGNSRLGQRPARLPAAAALPYKLYNIGNNNPVELGRFISILEDALGRKAEKNLLPMQPGDVVRRPMPMSTTWLQTWALSPATSLEVGLRALCRLVPAHLPARACFKS